jgi:flagellar basal-body rod modification protein FlgD
MEVSGLATSLNGGSGAASSAKNFADNFDTFLNLLTTQLQNQDPLSPMDSAQFTEQLVQFSQVEQAIATNKNLEEAISLITAGNGASAVNYLGRDIKAQGTQASLSGGQAKWSYDVGITTSKTAITITDENDKLVYVGQGATSKGEHVFTWDGKDNSGKVLPDGIYRIAISAETEGGASVPLATYVEGTVSGVNNDDSGANLLVGKVAIPLSKVVEVRDPAPAG